MPGFSGALADELANIRFEGERQAALDCLKQHFSITAIRMRRRS